VQKKIKQESYFVRNFSLSSLFHVQLQFVFTARSVQTALNGWRFTTTKQWRKPALYSPEYCSFVQMLILSLFIIFYFKNRQHSG